MKNPILKRNDGNRLFESLIKVPMQDLRFELDKGIFTRKRESGFEKISYESLEPFINAKFRLTDVAIKRINSIEEIWDDYFLEITPLGVGEGYVNTTMAFNAGRIKSYKYDPTIKNQLYRTSYRYEADATNEGVHELAKQFLENMLMYVIPALEKYDNIKVLDSFVNEKPDYYLEVMHLVPGNGLEFRKMIIAKLAGNPQYELVCEAMKKRILTMENVKGIAPKENYLSIFEKLQERLKNAQPLE